MKHKSAILPLAVIGIQSVLLGPQAYRAVKTETPSSSSRIVSITDGIKHGFSAVYKAVANDGVLTPMPSRPLTAALAGTTTVSASPGILVGSALAALNHK